MGMYLINTQLELNWILRNSLVGIDRTTLDIRLRPPVETNRGVIYYPSAIAVEDFVAPTPDTDGWATWRFTPDALGTWEVALTNGTDVLNTFYYDQHIEVEQPDTHIRKFIPGSRL